MDVRRSPSDDAKHSGDWGARADEALFQRQIRATICLLTEPRVGRTRSQSVWSGKDPKAKVNPSPRTAEKREFVARIRFCRNTIEISHNETPISALGHGNRMSCPGVVSKQEALPVDSF
ncbi:hypothetical protein E3U44_10445 [Nitrosococcus wardiae]|uniref:Uncharacterized protein n=1 Tax=Nitrosococcus wardiae TaxID=1814290 RepID=A0A4P7BZV1_9GAMM|nr:hypothetical protein E3U44_10445 [Nitrosococcus wardiae]